MYLMRMVYCSKMSDEFSTKEIDQILASGRLNNKKVGVTGLLCFNRKYFLQCLEGGRTEFNKIYHAILNDRRHHNIVLLSYDEIVEREFAHWSMAYVPEVKITDEINMRFSGTPDFDPFSMHGESTFKMLQELKSQISEI